MNIKEIGEIRRRVRRDRSNMTAIYGCYVNSQKQIITEFKQSTGIMPENEAEKYFGLLKRTLSGTIGKNLLNITFQTQQVMKSDEHKLLMDLRATKLQEGQYRHDLYKKIIDTVTLDDAFLILLGCDSYDVPFKSKDDETQADASGDVFTYLLCAVCPVKEAKPTLRYEAESKEFHDGGLAQIAVAPEAGFMFPSFDDRATNIYNALFYTHSPKIGHDSMIEALFGARAPICAAEQKKSFEALLTTSLGDECSLDAVQSVHDNLRERMLLHKESRIPDPLLVNKEQVREALAESGVGEKGIAKFSVDFDQVFGHDAQLHPTNIINHRKVEIKTPDVSITVNPERSDLIETRVIDGVKYILICADDNVEVNGVNIQIRDN